MKHRQWLLIGTALLLAVGAVQADTPSPMDTAAVVTTVQTFTDKDGVKWQVTKVETTTVTWAKVGPVVVPGPVTPPPPPVVPPVVVTPPPVVEREAGFWNANGVLVTTAKVGDVLTLVGTGFGVPAPAGNRVSLNGTTAPIQVWTDKAVTFTVPPGVSGVVLVKLWSLAAASANWQPVGTSTGLTVTP